MRFSQLRNSRIPSKNLEFLSKILEFPRNFRIPKPCIIIGLDPMISVLGNSKIPYRDPRVKLGDDTEHARRAFYRDCFASLAMTEF